MMGRASPVAGKVTRNWRGAGRVGVGRTTGEKETMGLALFMGMRAAAPMRLWDLVCILVCLSYKI